MTCGAQLEPGKSVRVDARGPGEARKCVASTARKESLISKDGVGYREIPKWSSKTGCKWALLDWLRIPKTVRRINGVLAPFALKVKGPGNG
jgi:hypothetical protein